MSKSKSCNRSRELICEALRRFVLALRDRDRCGRHRRVVLFRRCGLEFHPAAPKPRPVQFHAKREPVWGLAIACRPWVAPIGDCLDSREQEMVARFPCNARSDGAGRCCGTHNQARHSAAATVSAHRDSLGRAALQHQVSFVPIRTCWSFDCVLCRSIYRASTRRPCVPPNPDSNRILTDVHRRALSLRCCLRGRSGTLVRSARCMAAGKRTSNSDDQSSNCPEALRWSKALADSPPAPWLPRIAKVTRLLRKSVRRLADWEE